MNIKPNTFNLQNRIDYCLALLAQNRPNVEMSWHDTEVRMSHRLKRCAGRVKHWRVTGKLLVEFSESMFANMTEMEKTETVAHELAHCVCFRNPMLGSNHDRGWKAVCRDMGGDGSRLLVTHAPVQKNVVKRVVLADKANAYSLMIRTKMQAERLTCVRPEVVRLGSIAINYNDKTYRWASVVNQDVLTIKVLKESLGWKLVG
jgi:predicted SprT family Zn-dependent metalloprotease